MIAFWTVSPQQEQVEQEQILGDVDAAGKNDSSKKVVSIIIIFFLSLMLFTSTHRSRAKLK